MTPERLADLRAEHVPHQYGVSQQRCRTCHEYWPCPVSELLNVVDALTTENARLNAAIASAWDQTRETISTSYTWQPPAGPAEPEKNSHVH
jgi:hypothetical protein